MWGVGLREADLATIKFHVMFFIAIAPGTGSEEARGLFSQDSQSVAFTLLY